MFEIKYKIKEDIQLYSFEFKNADIIFSEYPKFFKIVKDDIDFSYLTKRSYWIENKKTNIIKINNIKEKIECKKEIEYIDTPVFFLFDDYYANYLHYFLESFPKIEYFLKLKEKILNLKLTIPDYVWNMPFIKESIILYLNNNISDVLILNTNKKYVCSLIYIPCNIYIWPDSSNFSNIIFDSSKKLGDKIVGEEKKEGVYISRQDVFRKGWWHDRYLENESILIKQIKTELNYDIIELYDLDIYNKIKIFKNYKNIIQTSGAGMINLLFCKSNTNFHIISHPLYSWPNPILKDASNRLNVNFYEYYFGKVCSENPTKCGNPDNKPWKITDIDSLINQIKNNI